MVNFNFYPHLQGMVKIFYKNTNYLMNGLIEILGLTHNHFS